jgi:hypothetical protein
VLLGVLFVEPVELGALLISRVEVAVEAHHLLEGRLHLPIVPRGLVSEW